jgi:ABC-type dipeptide/oligopeptide/nickel transport system permease subunit
VTRATIALRRDRRAWFGVGVIVAMIAAAVLAPLIARYDPTAIDLPSQLLPPSSFHWFGTDVQGRDVWARLVYGARVSLGIGVASQTIALGLGLTLGVIAGYFGRWVDEIVMRFADITMAFPTLLLLVALVAALQPSLMIVFVTIGSRSRSGARGA